MKKAIAGLFASCLLATAAAWADPLKEMAEVAAPRAKAYMAGDLDGWTGAYAENAVFFGSDGPFRVEGKAAIRAAISEHFNQFPNRRYFLRQPIARAYGDSLITADGYFELMLTDRAGKHIVQYGRYTVTWAKLDGRWQIIQHQNAPLPNGF